MSKIKIIRACTVPQSLGFVDGMIEDLQNKYEVILLSSFGPEWENIHKKHPDIQCLKIDMERHISIIKDFRSLWKLLCAFLKHKPSMVHSMTPKAGLLCMMAAWAARVPVRVHTFTGLVFPTSTGFTKKVLMATDRLTCFFATSIIPEGEGVKNDLLNNNITNKSIKVLGYGSCKGIDLDYFDPTLNYQSCSSLNEYTDILDKERNVIFISIGRLVRDKGINELVSAFLRINNDNPNTRLILVGKEEKLLDPLNRATLEFIEACPAIVTVGRQKDVRPWLAISDVAILASYREGFPNVVIEAGAMGLPQIVTDINGSKEIIVNEENGIIIPPKNENALYG